MLPLRLVGLVVADFELAVVPPPSKVLVQALKLKRFISISVLVIGMGGRDNSNLFCEKL